MTGSRVPDLDLVDSQRHHWAATFAASPEMYGSRPSEAGRYAAERFVADGFSEVLELGPGQGRDTVALLMVGLSVQALDFTTVALDQVAAAAGPQLAQRLTTLGHDVRKPLPFEDASFDACYSHMLFTMALTTPELERLAGEVHRVLRPGGLCIYTARHTGDAHYGTGRALGDGLFENGGFVVHFFDRALVEDLAVGFDQLEVIPFEEGDLPRRLWRVTQHKP